VRRARRAASIAAASGLLAALVVAAAPPAAAAACPTVDPGTGAVTGLAAPPAVYLDCDMSGADLSGRVLNSVTFMGSDFTGATFADSLLIDTTLTGTLHGTDFSRAVTDGLSITAAASTGVILRDAYLPGAQLTGLSGADARGADLTGASLIGTWAGALLDDAVLRFSSWSQTYLAGASLVGADLTGALFQSANLSGADLTGAILTAAWIKSGTLSGATLASASADGLRATSFAGAPASLPTGWLHRQGMLIGPRANLSEWPLQEMDLGGADLRGIDLSGATLTLVDLSGADLGQADLSGTTFVQSDLTGALGLGTAYTTSATRWNDTTCTDGQSSYEHEQQSCTRPLDTVAPVPTLGTLPRWGNLPSAGPLTVAVSGTDAGTASSALNYRLRWRTTTAGGAGAFSSYAYGDWTMPDRGRLEGIPAPPGRRVCVSLQARDMAFNVRTTGYERCFDVPYDSTGQTFDVSSRWTIASGSTWSGFAVASTTTKGQSILGSSKRYVREIGVVATTCPTCGALAVYVGATKIGTLSLVRSTTTTRALVTLPRLSQRRYGTVSFVVSSSSGRLVRVDSVAVSGV